MTKNLEGYLLKRADRRILQYLASHPKEVGKSTSVDNLYKILSKNGVSRQQVIDTLKAFAYEKAGTFYAGRHGYKSRIVWLTDRQAVAAKILEQRGKTAKEERTNHVTPTNNVLRLEEDEETPQLLRYPFMLRAKLEVTLHLPADLTSQEAARLSEFIKALPLT